MELPDNAAAGDSQVALTVVIACRNAAGVLGFQLLALSRQRSPLPWELLLCDNGSVDDTVEVARSWAGRLPLRIVDASRAQGLTAARNLGGRAARGTWIAFCEADMEVGEGWLPTLCGALAEHPAVTGRFVLHGPESEHRRGGLRAGHASWFRRSPLVSGLPRDGGGNLGVRRSVFLAVGGFDPSVASLAYTDLCWRIRSSGHEPIVVRDLVMHGWLRAGVREVFRRGRRQGAWYAELRARQATAAGDPSRPEADPAAWPVVDWTGADRSTLEPSREVAHAGGRAAPLTVRVSEWAWTLGWTVGRRDHGRRPRPRSAVRPPTDVPERRSPSVSDRVAS